MAIHIEVTTSNSLVTNDGGYHEIYSAKFLSSPQHAFATIQNIITNNKIFGDKDCPLVSVGVVCNDSLTYEYLKNQYTNDSLVSIVIKP